MEIDEKYRDAIKELINIGIGKGAEVLNTMLHSHIVLTVPSLQVVTACNFRDLMPLEDDTELAAVTLGYDGSFSGSTKLVFPADSASKLVAALTGEEPSQEELDEIQSGTLCEIGNIVVNAVMGSLSNVLLLNFRYQVPVFSSGVYESLFAEELVVEDEVFLIARARFSVETLDIDGDIVLSLETSSFEQIIAAIDAFVED